MFFLISTQIFAQDKKWSIEANYPLQAGNDIISEKSNGLIDFGLKYRFADLGLVKLGAGFNAGLFTESDNSIVTLDNMTNVNSNYDSKNYILQPKVFAEFHIPAVERLKPFVGLGYSVVVFDVFFDDGVRGTVIDDTSTNGGINLNAGLSFDITKRLFIQGQYDYINLRVKNASTGQKGTIDSGFLKFGLGFRF